MKTWSRATDDNTIVTSQINQLIECWTSDVCERENYHIHHFDWNATASAIDGGEDDFCGDFLFLPQNVSHRRRLNLWLGEFNLLQELRCCAGRAVIHFNRFLFHFIRTCLDKLSIKLCGNDNIFSSFGSTAYVTAPEIELIYQTSFVLNRW